MSNYILAFFFFNHFFGDEYEEIPHGNTVNQYFKEILVGQFRGVLYGRANDLIKKKIVNEYSISNTWYQLIIDGVSLYIYHQEHIGGNIVKKHNDEMTTYQTDMLLAYIAV